MNTTTRKPPERPPSDEALTLAYKAIGNTAVSIINSTRLEFQPQLAVMRLDDNGKPVLVSMLPGSLMQRVMRIGRHLLPVLIDELLLERAGDIVVHACEAWRADATRPGVDELIASGVRVEHVPGAIETLAIAVHTRDRMASSLSTIERRADGSRHVELAELEQVHASIANPTAQEVRAMREASDKFNEGKQQP